MTLPTLLAFGNPGHRDPSSVWYAAARLLAPHGNARKLPKGDRQMWDTSTDSEGSKDLSRICHLYLLAHQTRASNQDRCCRQRINTRLCACRERGFRIVFEAIRYET
ncbi:hypothetical protein CNECB9_560042 [Cupriavidus necator]|uniref:Uncharacterized protein n=1 Tax=Cupriavidus necator TaxID=106590 RepID=A0A1K0JPY0_CUPNE|nr:hypothetical protein CNECB9_560042 [Cupriavidus necator]